MANSGTFTLQTAEEKNSPFTAYSELITRLKSITTDISKLSTDHIEETHLMYTKTRYIPYVAVASEYDKKTPAWSGRLGVTGGTVDFELPNNGTFTNDIVIHVKFEGVGSKSAFDNNEEPTESTPLYRYCSYPGIRLFKKVEFRYGNGLVIDSYTPEDVIAYKNFFLTANHKSGWGRCYGQDEIQQATYNNKSFTGILNYSDGAQTPKLYQTELNMFIPLQFWFCEDVSTALPNSLTLTSQRSVRIELAPLEDIIQALVYDIHVNNTVEEINKNVVPFSTRQVPLPIKELKCSLAMYVNQLYTNGEIGAIINYEANTNLNLIRCHKRQISDIMVPTSAGGTVKITPDIKQPCEYLMVGVRNKTNALDFDRWHLMGSEAITADTNHINTLSLPVIIWNNVLNIHQLVTRDAIKITTLRSVMEYFTILNNTIDMFKSAMPSSFFNDYLPIRYGKNTITVSPFDNNMFMIPFCLYPGKSNPSGVIDFSLNKEIEIKYQLLPEFNVPECTDKFQMVIVASTLNFLIIRDDQLNVRYSI